MRAVAPCRSPTRGGRGADIVRVPAVRWSHGRLFAPPLPTSGDDGACAHARTPPRTPRFYHRDVGPCAPCCLWFLFSMRMHAAQYTHAAARGARGRGQGSTRAVRVQRQGRERTGGAARSGQPTRPRTRHSRHRRRHVRGSHAPRARHGRREERDRTVRSVQRQVAKELPLHRVQRVLVGSDHRGAAAAVGVRRNPARTNADRSRCKSVSVPRHVACFPLPVSQPARACILPRRARVV